jgi:hypothetical protein
MNDFVALLVLRLDDSVDRVSAQMFAARLTELGWTETLPGAWTLGFDARSRHSCAGTVKEHLDLACRFARIGRGQVCAVVHFGDEDPATV